MKLTKNSIEIRVTELANSLKCLKKLYWAYTNSSKSGFSCIDIEEKNESEAIKVGTEIHKQIYEFFMFNHQINDPNLKTINFHKDMFEKQLTRFEVPIKQTYYINGVNVLLTGTVDACSEDFRYLVDWKTTATKKVTSLQYKYQLGLYAMILNDNSQCNDCEFIANIAWIQKHKIKHKVTDFYSTIYTFTKEDINKFRLLFKQQINSIIHFDNNPPLPCYSELHCVYCENKQYCSIIDGIIGE